MTKSQLAFVKRSGAAFVAKTLSFPGRMRIRHEMDKLASSLRGDAAHARFHVLVNELLLDAGLASNDDADGAGGRADGGTWERWVWKHHRSTMRQFCQGVAELLEQQRRVLVIAAAVRITVAKTPQVGGTTVARIRNQIKQLQLQLGHSRVVDRHTEGSPPLAAIQTIAELQATIDAAKHEAGPAFEIRFDNHARELTVQSILLAGLSEQVDELITKLVAVTTIK